MTNIPFHIPIPDFIMRICVWFLLRHKKARFGHEFKAIKLTQGRYAIVSLEDYDLLNQYKWGIRNCSGIVYAARKENGKKVYMHNQIMQPPQGFVVDHDDHNGLNNSRDNLRLATRMQNCCNRRKQTGGTSKYKGVCRRGRKWLVQISFNGRKMHLGYFDNETDAAKAYDESAKKYHGEFAMLNFDDKKSRRINPPAKYFK